MLSVIAGPDERDRLSIPTSDVDWMEAAKPRDLKGLRVAYSSDWGYAAVDPEVRRVVGEAVRVFEKDLGCTVEEAHPGFTDPLGAFWALVAMESDLKGMRAIVAEHGGKMTPHLVDFIRRDWTAEDLTGAIMVRKAVTNKMWRFMRKYDLLLTPTLAVPPFALHIQGVEKIDGRMVTPSQWLAFTFPFNMTGQPAASVPAGFTKDGLTGRVADRRPSPRRRLGAASRRVVRGGKALGGCVARNGAMTTTDLFRIAGANCQRCAASGSWC